MSEGEVKYRPPLRCWVCDKPAPLNVEHPPEWAFLDNGLCFCCNAHYRQWYEFELVRTGSPLSRELARVRHAEVRRKELAERLQEILDLFEDQGFYRVPTALQFLERIDSAIVDCYYDEFYDMWGGDDY